MLPFTADQFFQVFENCNIAIWPVQIVAYVMALLMLVVLRTNIAYHFTLLLLGILWIWNGLAYHLTFFARINAAAYGFAALFVAQGILFLVVAVRRAPADTSFQLNPAQWIGAALIAYALAIYNLVGGLSGHTWPRTPVFGVAPCPTVIFTFGILMLLPQRIPGWILIIPLAWAAIGSTAALLFFVWEDLGLLVAGLVTVGWIALRGKEKANGAFQQMGA